MGKATQNLRDEHDTIIHVLDILDGMLVSDGIEPEVLFGYYGEVVEFLKIFADKCHHGKEEDHLFVELIHHGIQNEGGPVGVMLKEHGQAREFIGLMQENLDRKNIHGFNRAASHYRDLLRRHIEKENEVLFMIADKVLDDTVQDRLFEAFEQHEEKVIGHGVHDKLHAMIGVWEQTFRTQ